MASPATTITMYEEYSSGHSTLRSLVSINNSSSSDVDTSHTTHRRTEHHDQDQMKLIDTFSALNPPSSIGGTQSRLMRSNVVTDSKLADGSKYETVLPDQHLAVPIAYPLIPPISHMTAADRNPLIAKGPKSGKGRHRIQSIKSFKVFKEWQSQLYHKGSQSNQCYNGYVTRSQRKYMEKMRKKRWKDRHRFTPYQSTRNFTIPLPSPIPDPMICPNRRTIYSRNRNIKIPPRATTPWPGYRLGDIFKTNKSHLPDLWDEHYRDFPTSLAVEYGQRGGMDSDHDVMIQIITERIGESETLQSMLPDNRTLVIHLRTGDVIDDKNPFTALPIREYLSFDNVTAAKRKGKWQTRGLPFYADIWDQIQRDGVPIDRILVITGWHFNIYHYRSIAYINEVIKYLEQMVDEVDIRVNENPDEDVIIMSQSTYFVESGGGFSRMIAGLVDKMGGTVYGYDVGDSMTVSRNYHENAEFG